MKLDLHGIFNIGKEKGLSHDEALRTARCLEHHPEYFDMMKARCSEY